MKNAPNKKKVVLVSSFIVCFVAGAVFGWLISIPKAIDPVTSVRENSSNYKLINPILFLKVPENESAPEFQYIKKEIEKYIATALGKKNATNISIYFRELNTDRWVGVNPDDTYTPASMLKVATLIAFLRASQENPSLLSKKVLLSSGSSMQDASTQDYYPPSHKAKIGNIYSVDELLSYAIVDSDNNAAEAIGILAGNDVILNTYNVLGIPVGDGKLDEFMSAKLYSRLFRVLYNGTFISRELSEKALDLLARTSFPEGLVAGIDSGVTVAHKFGERTIDVVDTSLTKENQLVHQIRELHDCGIIYMPKDPYFLCVMTKGSEFSSLQKVISDISSIVWQKMKALEK